MDKIFPFYEEANPSPNMSDEQKKWLAQQFEDAKPKMSTSLIIVDYGTPGPNCFNPLNHEQTK